MNKTRVAELSDNEAIKLFNEDPVKNFDVLRNRHIAGVCHLPWNKKITTLPEGLTVGCWLALHDCTNLTSLPEGLWVGGSLNLDGCTSLASLPDGLKVDGWLSLYGCESLTSLPEGLTVGGYLTLDGCTDLTSLPEELVINGDFNMYGCTKLKVWLVKERKIEWLKRKVGGKICGLLE